MKKLFALILGAVLCCCFTACAHPGAGIEEDKTGNQLNNPPGQTEGTLPDSYSDIALGFSTLEEYKEHFAKSGGYPAGFISYEKLQSFGQFVGFSSQSYIGKNPDYSQYRYHLVDSTGMKIYVDVEPCDLLRNSYKWEADSVEDTMTGVDLRRNDTVKKLGRVMCGNFLYKYRLGELHAISWIEEGKEITITAEFCDYPSAKKDTLLGKLLNYQTAQTTMEALSFYAEQYQHRGTEPDGSDSLRQNAYETIEIDTLEKYKQHFASEKNCPADFIAYDNIRELGTFKGFATHSYTGENPDYRYYSYVIQTPGELRLTVNITPIELPKYRKLWSADHIEETRVGNDLRRNNTTKETGNIACGAAMYFYRMGQLEAISWTAGDKMVTLCAPFHTYPLELSETLLGRLLNKDTAPAAMAELGMV